MRNARRPPRDDAKVAREALGRLQVRREFIGDSRIEGATLLEIGSGREFSLALLLLALGARRVINVEIDPFGFIDDASYYRVLVAAAREEGLPIDWPPAGLIEEPGGSRVRPNPARIALHIGRSAATIPEPDGSVDVTFSVAVLEHVSADAMPFVASELCRLTRPGGVGYHRVDLADHYSRRTEPFRMLQYSPREYRWMYGRRGSSSNRLRMDDIVSIYRSAGFSKVGVEDVRRFADVERFDCWVSRFHPDFRDGDRDMLRTLEFMLVLER
ncbi:MAG: methyltransferase domain-containing protein [Candidatus Eisenbacteria bacterium]|nr:methyltransferase domain-containing protein [Candidatus Eisenbacteria bacterium]